jgi:hypothetical protein
VNLLSAGRRQRNGARSTVVGRAVRVASASYNPSTQQVSLTLGATVRTNQMFQLKVVGGSGGITDQSGTPLNSPSQGAAGGDFVYDIN